MSAAHSSYPLPLTIEEISPAFLNSALSARFPNAPIDKFEITDVRHGFTTVIRIRLDSALQAKGMPQTLILKGGFEAFTREKAREYAILPLGMEVNSYRQLRPTLGLNMPECYFAEFDADRAQMIVLMEDLVARKVKFSHGLRPQSPAQVKRRLTSLAEFHAKTWGSKDLEPGGRWDIFPKNGAAMFRSYMEHADYNSTWLRYVEMPRGAAVSTQFHDLDWMRVALDHMSALADQLPGCVVHGDTHLGNLYEEPDGTPGFFDALPRREPAMMEVCYHITNALDASDRRRFDKELVAHYRDELVRRDVNVPSIDDLMYQFSAFLPFGFVTFMVNEAKYQTEAFNTAHTARYGAAMLDHATKELVETFARSQH